MTKRLRPWRLPAGRDVSRNAMLALCAVAPSRAAAEEALMAAGLIRDPVVPDAHIGASRATLTATIRGAQ